MTQRNESVRPGSGAHLSWEEEQQYALALTKLDCNTWMLVLESPQARSSLVALAARLRPQQRHAVCASTNHASQMRSFSDLGSPARDLFATDPDRWILDTVVSALDAKGDHAAILDSRVVGLDVRNRFVMSHMGLAIAIARKHRERGAAGEDILDEAVIGLIRAVHRFNPSLGFRFATYAHHVIDGTLRRQILKSRLLTVPEGVVYAHARVVKARDRLVTLLSRNPSVQEIAAETGVSAAEVRRLLESASPTTVSYDAPLGPESRHALSDTLANESALALDVAAGAHELSLAMAPLIDNLAPIERDVVLRRFGLRDREEETLQEIGAEHNLTRERIRQIQEQALSKLRRACRAAMLGK